MQGLWNFIRHEWLFKFIVIVFGVFAMLATVSFYSKPVKFCHVAVDGQQTTEIVRLPGLIDHANHERDYEGVCQDGGRPKSKDGD